MEGPPQSSLCGLDPRAPLQIDAGLHHRRGRLTLTLVVRARDACRPRTKLRCAWPPACPRPRRRLGFTPGRLNFCAGLERPHAAKGRLRLAGSLCTRTIQCGSRLIQMQPCSLLARACPSRSRDILPQAWQKWRRFPQHLVRRGLPLQLGARTALLLPMARATHPASEARPRPSPASSHACTPLLPVCHPVPHASSLPRPALRAQVASSSAPDYVLVPSSASSARPAGCAALAAVSGALGRVHACSRPSAHPRPAAPDALLAALSLSAGQMLSMSMGPELPTAAPAASAAASAASAAASAVGVASQEGPKIRPRCKCTLCVPKVVTRYVPCVGTPLEAVATKN